MNVAILGSGFGLYGYLPALLRVGDCRPMLPERYRVRLQARADVRGLEKRVLWQHDDETLLDAADAVIVTQRPQDQAERIATWLERARIKRILLEKPIAPTPEAALRVLDAVEGSGRVLRTGCTFRYTPWGRALLANPPRSARRPLEIVWMFRAHHYAHGLSNWKRFVSMGGGVLRFYGIHLLALLAECGYRKVVYSETSADCPDEAETWRAEFHAPMLAPCIVRVASNASTTTFSLIGDGVDVRLDDPFEMTTVDHDFDRRVTILTDLCHDFLQNRALSCQWHRPWLELWAAAEVGLAI